MVRPAQNFIARGGAGRSMSQEAADGVLLSDAAQQARGADRPAGEGVSRSGRRRRAAKERAEKEKGDKQPSNPWKANGAPKENASSGSLERCSSLYA